jgi:hypothetical protein
MYPDDMIAGMVYAKPLVFFIRKKLDEAKQTLLLANERLPNVARELMKSRHTAPGGKPRDQWLAELQHMALTPLFRELD